MATVTADLSCTATGVATKIVQPTSIKLATGAGTVTFKRDVIKKLGATGVAAPSKLMAVARIMPTVVAVSIPKKLILIGRAVTAIGISVPRVLRQQNRTILTTRVCAPVVVLIRFGASAWNEIDAHRKWGITNVGKWSIKQVQRFQFSSAMKGR